MSPRTKFHVNLPEGYADGPVTVTDPGVASYDVDVKDGRVVVDDEAAALAVRAGFPGSVIDYPDSPPAEAGAPAGSPGTPS
jgi:hypothetical protein